MTDLDEVLSSFQSSGYLVAPAGYGKSHLIARAVERCKGPQLILTHTYAGVHSLRKKLHAEQVLSASYHLTTIASWALRLCLAFPKTSEWRDRLPRNNQWPEVYTHCANLLGKQFIRDIVSASYAGVFVDEYQDCSLSQHNLMKSLASELPLRVLGDPLQAIFESVNTTADPPVNWESDVSSQFEHLGDLTVPWRWKNVETMEIAYWLEGVRKKLLEGKPIDLSKGMPNGVMVKFVGNEDELRQQQFSTCRWFTLKEGENAVAIHKGDGRFKAKCHTLAKQTSGKFSSIEEVEGQRLSTFILSYGTKPSNKDKLLECIAFTKDKCMSGVNAALSAGTKKGENVTLRKATKNPSLTEAANTFLSTGAEADLLNFWSELRLVDETTLYARDLFYRAQKVFENSARAPSMGIEVALGKFQNEFRYLGRPMQFPKIVSTTLLLKGLEFDHCIVLDATSLSKKDLYVALTRARKSITIISRNRVLYPQG